MSMGCETCAFCLMLASRGAVYHSRKTAGELMHFHRGCDCKVVPGFEDDPDAVLVEGHDPKVAYQQWKRIDNAKTLSKELYSGSVDEIEREALELDHMARRLWKTGLDGVAEKISSAGTVAFEQHVIPKGKELQEAKWLAAMGWNVTFRYDMAHLFNDGNTSDIFVDGETWDLKRIVSANPNKIAQNIFKKNLQGPNFVIDLSISDMTESAALAKCASILDDARVERILLIVARKAILLKKRA